MVSEYLRTSLDQLLSVRQADIIARVDRLPSPLWSADEFVGLVGERLLRKLIFIQLFHAIIIKHIISKRNF